jgi:hypothetical protein
MAINRKAILQHMVWPKESDPELMKARLVIGDVNDALTSVMRTDSRFELVYEDAIAVVFVASTDGVFV